MIGDDIDADVKGALGVGMTPVLFDSASEEEKERLFGREFAVIRRMEDLFKVLEVPVLEAPELRFPDLDMRYMVMPARKMAKLGVQKLEIPVMDIASLRIAALEITPLETPEKFAHHSETVIQCPYNATWHPKISMFLRFLPRDPHRKPLAMFKSKLVIFFTWKC